MGIEIPPPESNNPDGEHQVDALHQGQDTPYSRLQPTFPPLPPGGQLPPGYGGPPPPGSGPDRILPPGYGYPPPPGDGPPPGFQPPPLDQGVLPIPTWEPPGGIYGEPPDAKDC